MDGKTDDDDEHYDDDNDDDDEDENDNDDDDDDDEVSDDDYANIALDLVDFWVFRKVFHDWEEAKVVLTTLMVKGGVQKIMRGQF